MLSENAHLRRGIQVSGMEALKKNENVQNAAGVFKEDKDLPGLMAATASVYESSAYLVGSDPKTPQDPRRTIPLGDKWCRMEIARLCAAAVYADWTSTQDFVKRVGAPFWKMLCLLGTRFVKLAISEEILGNC